MTYINVGLKVPLLDAIDRYTIIELKSERLTNEADRPSVEKEYDFFKRVLDAYRAEGVTVREEWLKTMKDINALIWDVEADIRNAKRNNLSDEEVGVLWVRLRDLNNIRGDKVRAMRAEINDDFFEIPPTLEPRSDTSLKLPLHEVIDRVTIAELKTERLTSDPNIDSYKREYAFYQRILDAYRAEGIAIQAEWIRGMKDINGRVWDLESAVRQGKEKQFSIAELGQRVLYLRELSKERVAWKNSVSKAIGSDIYEVKTETI